MNKKEADKFGKEWDNSPNEIKYPYQCNECGKPVKHDSLCRSCFFRLKNKKEVDWHNIYKSDNRKKDDWHNIYKNN